jgi:endonuclease/exonuclease/phosphatase family metal-dependent hydrolase
VGFPTISLASLNVAGLPSALPPLRERAVELGRWFEASGIDVLNLQEVWSRHQLATVRAHLPSYGFVAWRPGVAGQPAGGLVTLSRLPLGPVSYTSFRDARAGLGGVLFRAQLALNTRLQGVLTVALSTLPVVLGNVHLTANRDGDWSARNRYHAFQRAQLDLLQGVTRPMRDSGLMLLSGDFNVSSTSALYERVVDGGAWRDPFRDADPPTFQQQFLPPGRPSHRIDYLLVSGDAHRYPVVETRLLFAEPVGGSYVSDHVGLLARVGCG